MGEWIDVKERLPEKNTRVLIYIKPRKGLNPHITVAKFIGDMFLGGEGYFSFENATHWMPLPEPPTERRGNNG